MDIATILGMVIAVGALLSMMSIEGANLTSILLPGPLILVFGATLAIGIASVTLKDAIRSLKAIPRAFLGKVPKPQVAIDKVVAIAEHARKDGLLALEQEARDTKDPFLRGALQSVADGTDAEELRIVMEEQIGTKQRADHVASKFFMGLGGYAPTVGIIGTVVSLTHVLENLSEPDELGHMIAAAFVATLWGVLSANFIWLPIGAKLKRVSELELEVMTIYMEGILAVQAGGKPKVVAERMRAMVPAHDLPRQKQAA